MYYAELKTMGWTDEALAEAASKMFGKEITLDGSDDPLTRARRGLWFREYTQRTMNPGKTYEINSGPEIGATVRGPVPPPKEPAPYPPEDDIPGAMAWADNAMDDGTYVSGRDDVALHVLNGDHAAAFEEAWAEMCRRRYAAGKPVL